MRWPFNITPMQLISGLTILLIAAFAVWKISTGWSVDDFVQSARALPNFWLIASFASLPLIGAPISIFLMAAGMKYGFAMGMLITGVCMAIHHFAVWFIAHTWLRDRLAGWLDRFDHEIPSVPERHQTWFMIVFTAAPGLAYVVKLYAITLTGMPFRKYFGLGWPIHTLSSFLFIGMGDAAGRTNTWTLAALGTCFVVGIGISWWLKQRMQSNRSEESGGEEHPAVLPSIVDQSGRNIANEGV